MSRHQLDLVMCLKQPGTSIGKLCEKCDGRCPVCDSYVSPRQKVRICDDCSFGKQGDRCIICGNRGYSEAFYCVQCCKTEKSQEGCPRIINIGTNRTDLFYEKKQSRHIS